MPKKQPPARVDQSGNKDGQPNPQKRQLETNLTRLKRVQQRKKAVDPKSNAPAINARTKDQSPTPKKGRTQQRRGNHFKRVSKIPSKESRPSSKRTASIHARPRVSTQCGNAEGKKPPKILQIVKEQGRRHQYRPLRKSASSPHRVTELSQKKNSPDP